MFLRPLLALAAIAMLSTPALAFHCPKDVAAIDAALGKMQGMDDTRAQVKQLRDEGLALHEAGKHKEAVDKLAEAMRTLLNAM